MSSPHHRIQGRTAIVTGAAGDIGSAIAQRLAQAGANVALLDYEAEALARRHEQWVREAGAARVLLLPMCDVSDEAQVDAAVARVVGHFGALHILVNNAAMVTPKAAVHELPSALWRRTLDVNLTGAWLMARAAMPRMCEAGGGTVLNVASQMAHVATPGSAAYAATKAALVALARAIAVDGAPLGIRGLSLSPGAVMTSRLTDRYGSQDAVNALLAAKYLAHEIGGVDEVAEAAVYLIGGGPFLNGCDLLVDGGYTTV